MSHSEEDKKAFRLANADRFGWWWLQPEVALSEAFPNESAAALGNLFRGPLNTAAFWYEATARKSVRNGKQDKPAYEYGQPFHKLTLQQMLELRRRWPTPPSGPPAFQVWTAGDDPFSSVRTQLDSLADIDGTCLSTEAMDEQTKSREALLGKCTRQGWTTPVPFSFNLAECSDGTIAAWIKTWVAEQRRLLEIREPARNEGRTNHTKHSGKSFTPLEGIDVASDLSVREAQEWVCDGALISRMKADAVAKWEDWQKLTDGTEVYARRRKMNPQ